MMINILCINNKVTARAQHNMSVVSREEVSDLKPPTLKKATTRIFIRFASRMSFNQFQRQRDEAKIAQKLKKTSQDETNRDSPEQISLQKQSKINSIKVGEIEESRQLLCRKCGTKLFQVQFQGFICGECIRLDRLLASNSFQRFIMFILDFKTGKVPSFSSSALRLRRIQSIESIQSVNFDKHNDSAIKQSTGRFKMSGRIKQRQSSNRTPPNNFILSKRLTDTQGLSSGCGYYCNDCGDIPIKGRRFHCVFCSDFDLCQKCFFHSGHKHEMKTYSDSKEKVIKQMKQNTIKASMNLKHTLPLLSASIQQFQSIPKNLYTTYQFKKKPEVK